MLCIQLVKFNITILKHESVYSHLISLLIELYLRNVYENYKILQNRESLKFK